MTSHDDQEAEGPAQADLLAVRPSLRPPGAPAVLDRHTVAIGESLEDYGWLTAVQAYPRPGPRLPWDGWILMAEASRRRVRPTRLHRARSGYAQVLREHGLLDDEGRPTEAGRTISEAMSAVRVQVTATAWTARGRHRMEALVSGPTAVALTTPGPDTPPEEQDEDSSLRALDAFDVAWLPAAIASWTGTGPAWTVSITPDAIDHDVLLRRVRGEDAPPPPDADHHLLDVWRQPWCLWQLATPQQDPALTVLRAGRRGSYRVLGEEPTGRVRLSPLPSSVLWYDLVRLIDTALTNG